MPGEYDLGPWRWASCRNYRTPLMDLSSVDGIIGRALAEAWQKGIDPRTAVDQLLTDPSISRQFVDQLQPALQYQRQVDLSKLAKEAEAREYEFQRMRTAELGSSKDTHQKEIQTRAYALQQIREAYTKTQDAYTAAAAHLDDVKKRISLNLKSIGGVDGLDQLLKINQALLPPTDQAPSGTKADAKEIQEGNPISRLLRSFFNRFERRK